MSTTAFPAGVSFGQVRMRLVLPYADDVDGDGTPDAQPDTGQVTFTPVSGTTGKPVDVLLATNADAPQTIVGTGLSYAFDADGVLRDPYGADTVRLIANDSPGLRVPLAAGETPSDPEWFWVASFGLKTGRRDPFAFVVTTGQVLDLTDAQPLEVAGGVQITVGPPGSDGKSAYQVWLDLGNTGTEADFLASLTGPQGDPGAGNISTVNGDAGPDVVLTADDIGDGTSKVTMTADERTKLAGIADGATSTTAIADVTGLQDALDGKVDADELAANISVAVDDRTPIFLQYDTATSTMDVRPNTPRPVVWVYPSSFSVPLTGSTTGGTVAVVDGLDLLAVYQS